MLNLKFSDTEHPGSMEHCEKDKFKNYQSINVSSKVQNIFSKKNHRRKNFSNLKEMLIKV